MTWRDELKDASFRGVRFEYRATKDTLGRATITHQFPGRDKPYVQDQGLGPSRFVLDVFLCDENYHLQLKKLEDAIKAEGSGVLIHPYRGRINVTIEGQVEFVQSISEGGYASGSITFVEVDDTALPNIGVDDGVLVRELADDASAQAQGSFSDNFDISGLYQGARDGATSAVQGAASTLRKINGEVNGAMGAISEVDNAVKQLSDEASELINTPDQLASSFYQAASGMLASVETLNDNLLDKITAGRDGRIPIAGPVNTFFRASLLRRIVEKALEFESASSLPDGVTEQAIQEALNLSQIETMMRASIVIEAAPVAVGLDFQSSSDALDTLNTLYDAMTLIMEDAGDELFASLSDLRASTSNALRDSATELPSLASYTPRQTTDVLSLAHRLYGSIDAEANIIERNNLEAPGFIAGGVPVSVIKND